MAVWIAPARHLGLSALSGVVAGILVGGVLGRIAMRISGFAAGPALVGVSTASGERVGEITFGGTLAVLIFVGLPFGLMGGILYAIVEPWLRRARPWHGLVYGVGLLLAAGFLVLDPSNFDFTRFGPPTLNVAMFAALFVIFGVTIAWVFDVLRALREGSSRLARVIDVFAWLSLAPAVVAVLFFVGGATGLDPLLAVLVVALLLVPVIVRWRGLPRAIGYASLAGVVLLGAARTLSGLPSLLRGF